MDLINTTLDDVCAVIGFSATLRLVAWYGDGGNLYVPDSTEDGQVLVKLVGMPAAKALSKEWGRQFLAIPRLGQYEEDVRKQRVARMTEMGFGTRETAGHLRISERRVQQIRLELQGAKLLEKYLPKNARKSPGQNKGEKAALGKAPRALPSGFFGGHAPPA